MIDPDFDKRLGGRVRDVRKHYGWTQRRLAEKLFMSQHNLSRYERGEYVLTAKQVALLSSVFAITVDSWFVTDDIWQNFVKEL